ncbi:MAG: TIGR02597 family protein [Verrucomicrobiota bacterium]
MQKLILLLAISCIASYQSVTAATTDPIGYVNWDIAAGTGLTRTVTVLSVPLLDTTAIDGAATGKITGVTSNSITASGAGWTAGQLSEDATPYLIRITTGLAEGRTFLISSSVANTSTTVTLDSNDSAQVDLTTLGIVTAPGSEDNYKIIPCDTLSSIFGTPTDTGVLGGPSSDSADIIFLNDNGSWKKYFYNTALSRWTRIFPGYPDSSNVEIRPDSAIMYSRLGDTALALTVVGSVPMENRQSLIKNSGVTFLANSWPVDTTLATTNLQNTTGWVSNANSANADQVLILVNNSWRKYWHDGSNWRRIFPGFPISDSQSVSATSGLLIGKLGSASGNELLTQTKPY